ncbi:NLP/P60 protein [Crinalium epipsammum PCC 9333]|uniref:NLP/P60 protein n=1 Tax=Crinalium epipsammum PCC 9333 TaxID=1173022 RepID=K9W443_9CYAN|nr:C40 family peptidase [Crinalium epipsammum]AFZ14549.1 NLP/P60 protein [Crinalium epipsammum PCC 9333]
MVVFEQLAESLTGEYQSRVNLNLYDSPSCASLATQAAAGRHLHILSTTAQENAVEVRLCEDGYSAWLLIQDLQHLEPAKTAYSAIAVSSSEIQARIPTAIAFTQKAMQQDNYYLWGGTVAPNYDCSGLMQAAFASVGIWLPRDSYQQEAFTQPISLEQLQPGDLIFFGTPQKTTHVALHLGEGRYIHSSGKEIGRNGIGIDQLSEHGDQVSRSYYQQLRRAGRVIESYKPNN